MPGGDATWEAKKQFEQRLLSAGVFDFLDARGDNASVGILWKSCEAGIATGFVIAGRRAKTRFDESGLFAPLH